MDCFAALAMTTWHEPLSIRLHIFLGDNRVGRKSLVDEALLLQPFDLVGDIPDVELAFRVDIGAIADDLLTGRLVYLAMISSSGFVRSLMSALPSLMEARITS